MTIDPSLGLLELDSIAVGVATGDAMVKSSHLGSIYAGTVHPGRYLVLVSGDTASVDVALETGRERAGAHLLDSVFLADIHPDVAAALIDRDERARPTDGEAIAVLEAATVATMIDAADAGVKAAPVAIATIGLADGLGGKGYVVFGGVLADVEAAVEAAVARVDDSEAPHVEVIPQLADEMRHNLLRDLRFGARIVARPHERG